MYLDPGQCPTRVNGYYVRPMTHPPALPGISMRGGQGAQAMRAKSFDEGGAFTKLSRHEAEALVECARTTVDEMRAVDCADRNEFSARRTTLMPHRRKTNSQLELDALVKLYALALSFFARKARGVADVYAMVAALDECKTDQLKLGAGGTRVCRVVLGTLHVPERAAGCSGMRVSCVRLVRVVCLSCM